MNNVAEQIENFIEGINKKRCKYMAERGFDWEFSLTPQYGRKYIRLVTETQSAFLFIDMATGDILKSASWKSPAKGVRGSVFDENFSWGKGVGPYGAAHRYR